MSQDEDIIEMFWDCKSCGAETGGLTSEDKGLRCRGCGNQRTDEKWRFKGDPRTATAITDPKLLAAAKAGEVWVCTFCRHSERRENPSCSVCGGPKDAEVSLRPQAFTVPPVRQRKPRAAAAGLPNLPPPFKPWRLPFSLPVNALLVVSALVGVVLFGSWFFGSHETTANVSAVSWARTVTLEEKHTKSDEDWVGDVRSGAFDKSCVTKFRRFKECNPHKCNPRTVQKECNCTGGERYQCGSERGPCTSNNNGSASCPKVPKYCTSPRKCGKCPVTEWETCHDKCPVNDEWCSYKYDSWDVIMLETVSGKDDPPHWPMLEALVGQRLQRTERYEVVFKNSDQSKSWTLTPGTEAEFKRYLLGNKHKVEYSHAGTFKVLE